MNAAQREARLVKHYIRALGLCAVWRATDARGRRETGLTQDVPAAERRATARGFTTFEAWWAPSYRDAERALSMLSAGSVGPGLTSHAILTSRAKQAVSQIAVKIDNANRSGELRDLNARYRALRLRRKALGLSTYPYSTYLDRYAILMLYQTAAQVLSK